MNPQNEGLRKAAILVDCLDQAMADLLLEQMGSQYARLVRETMVDLGEVDAAEQRRVIDEFLRLEPLVPERDPAGIELNGRIARRLLSTPRIFSAPSPPAARRPAEAKPEPAGDPPFRVLRDTEAEKLARILAGERPQTTALVLSHLPPKQAGGVLVRLAPRLQAEVVRRLVDLEEADADVLREVERALEERLSEHVQMQRRRVAGLSAVAGILEAVGGQAGQEILDNLAAQDQPLAERLGPEPLEFEELVRLEGASLAAVLDAADAQLLLLALVGAPPGLAERFLQCLSQPQAAWIRRQLKQPGPTRLGDVTEARRRIAQLARRMAIQGRIRWSGKAAAEYPPTTVLEPAA